MAAPRMEREENQMTDSTRDRIAFWIGIAGGGVFMWANLTTGGEVPGGAVGGALGAIVFGGPAWLIFWSIQKLTNKAELE